MFVTYSIKNLIKNQYLSDDDNCLDFSQVPVLLVQTISIITSCSHDFSEGYESFVSVNGFACFYLFYCEEILFKCENL